MPICQACNSSFPWRVVIDGKKRFMANRKRCFKCSPFGAHNNKRVLPLPDHRSFCSDCGTALKSTRRKTCNGCQIRLYRMRLKLKAVALLGGKCAMCGYDRCTRALQFHHKDPKEKEFQISGSSASWARIKAEVLKCVLVCANCHIEVHDNTGE